MICSCNDFQEDRSVHILGLPMIGRELKKYLKDRTGCQVLGGGRLVMTNFVNFWLLPNGPTFSILLRSLFAIIVFLHLFY